jgi:metal-responsive CopG/Arc/MetJ family transcriptional regulator
MAKKVIQVPFDAELLEELDRISKRECKARAELIRDACREHLRRIEREEMDRVYRESYEKMPEPADAGMAEAEMLAEVLEEEPW